METILLALTLLVAAPTWILLLESLAATDPKLETDCHPSTGDTRALLAILIPAHDEEDSIAEVLDTLRPQLAPDDRLLVVADNCRDRTADAARAAGAEVIERCDPAHRGKGHALAFGIRHLRQAPPELLVIVDADCRVGPDALLRLERAARGSERPVQAAYLMEFPQGELAAVSAFAFFFKNWVRPLGLWRFGLPCQITGSGFALPWELVERVPQDRDNLVEDMQLGVDLTRLGHPPLFVPQATVWSQLPEKSVAAHGQRRRWEHGHLATALRQGPSLLLASLLSADFAGMALALDLLVPPLSLLALSAAGAWLISALGWWLGASAAPLTVASAALASLVSAVAWGWHCHGRDRISARVLLSAPLYATRKLPLYFTFLTRREREWVRTERPAGASDATDRPVGAATDGPATDGPATDDR